jgi:hypothetical protein
VASEMSCKKLWCLSKWGPGIISVGVAVPALEVQLPLSQGIIKWGQKFQLYMKLTIKVLNKVLETFQLHKY